MSVSFRQEQVDETRQSCSSGEGAAGHRLLEYFVL